MAQNKLKSAIAAPSPQNIHMDNLLAERLNIDYFYCCRTKDTFCFSANATITTYYYPSIHFWWYFLVSVTGVWCHLYVAKAGDTLKKITNHVIILVYFKLKVFIEESLKYELKLHPLSYVFIF